MSKYPDHEPACHDTHPRGVKLVIEPSPRDLGGFEVRRVLPSSRQRMVGPFIFFDEMGPAEFAPGHGIDVRPHPHIGLATITYLFDGELDHRDSLGFVQTIRPGAVNLMVAGRGIVHSERTGTVARRTGKRIHGIQTWIALPLEQEQCEPGFYHHSRETLPLIEDDAWRARVIAGSWRDAQSPVPAASPICYVDLALEAGATVEIEPQYSELAVYPLSGEVGLNGAPLAAHRMYLLDGEHTAQLQAQSAARAVLAGGEPLEGPRHIWWNFVSSSRERIERAKDDWRAMGFGTVPGDDEFIPLPED